MPPADEQHLRRDICRICRMMYARGLIEGPAGNVSARAGPDRILLTPSMLFKQRLRPEQLLAVGSQGERLGPESDASRDLRTTSELAMHLEVYRRRPDVGSVVHAHPPHCVALSIAGQPLQPALLTEGVGFLGAVPTALYGTPGTTEMSKAISDLIQDHDAVVLPYHGSLTVGRDVWEAYARLEVLEKLAQVQCLVQQLGGGSSLPAHEIEKLIAMRRRQVAGGAERDEPPSA